MKKIALLTLLSLCFVSINSCSTSQPARKVNKLKFAVQGGANIGGITENTDMTVVPGTENPTEAIVDAFSGATHTGINVGLHVNKPLKYNEVETGIDFMLNTQTFNYIDAGNKYIGVRDLNVSQIMFPLTYNFVFFRKLLPNTGIQLKIGYLGQLNFVSTSSTGILPDYSINRWSNGATFGISAVPFQLKGGRKLGVYFDAYRGTQIYKDFYNQTSFEMPGSSFMKFGLKYQF